jgi:SAM-dependent methyltransferase
LNEVTQKREGECSALERIPSARTPTPGAVYDPRRYWVSRHQELAGDIRSVGNKGKSIVENEEGYRRRGAALRAYIIRRLGPVRGKSALEFGCGIGMMAEGLAPLELEYTGVDISDVALEQAQRRCPRAMFHRADIIDFQPDRRSDLVLISSVLCHMVEPAHWRAVIGNMTRAVERDGAILLAEDLPPTSPIRYSNYVLHRTLGETKAAFLDLDVLLDPRESENPFHLARPGRSR